MGLKMMCYRITVYILTLFCKKRRSEESKCKESSKKVKLSSTAHKVLIYPPKYNWTHEIIDDTSTTLIKDGMYPLDCLNPFEGFITITKLNQQNGRITIIYQLVSTFNISIQWVGVISPQIN